MLFFCVWVYNQVIEIDDDKFSSIHFSNQWLKRFLLALSRLEFDGWRANVEQHRLLNRLISDSRCRIFEYHLFRFESMAANCRLRCVKIYLVTRDLCLTKMTTFVEDCRMPFASAAGSVKWWMRVSWNPSESPSLRLLISFIVLNEPILPRIKSSPSLSATRKDRV